MDFSTWIPEHPGLLPKWLLFISAVSILNGFSTIISAAGTRRVYAYTPVPVTDHAARLFGTWTTVSGIVRFYGAYDIENPVMYSLVQWTYIVALVHFTSEALVFRTTGLRTGAFSTYIIAAGTVAWMSWARDFYVR